MGMATHTDETANERKQPWKQDSKASVRRVVAMVLFTATYHKMSGTKRNVLSATDMKP
jgi:hypothetical protein